MDTPHTQATLDKILDEFKRTATKAANDAVQNAATPREAIHEAKGWREILGDAVDLSKMAYRGKPFPGSMSYPADTTGYTRRGFRMVPFRSNRYNAKSDVAYIEVDQLSDIVWVTGYNVESFSAPTKKKLVQWATSKGLTDVRHFILTDQPAPTYWIGADRVVDYATIKAVKLPLTQAQIDARAAGRQGTLSGRIPGSYDMYVYDGKGGNPTRHEGKPANDIDQTKPIYWSQSKTYSGREYADALVRLHPKGFTLVMLQANRVGKFQRSFSAAKPVRDGIALAHKKFCAALNDRTQKMLYVQDNVHLPSWVQTAVNAGTIKDPALREVVEFYKADLSAVKAEKRLYERLGFAVPRTTSGLVNPLNAYPLVSNRYGHCDPQHGTFYMNSLYEARQSGATTL